MDTIFGNMKRKRFLVYLDPNIYGAFRLLCKSRGNRRVNRVIESFMLLCIRNTAWLDLATRLAQEARPDLFHEPTEKEETMRRARHIIEEAKQLLETRENGEGSF